MTLAKPRSAALLAALCVLALLAFGATPAFAHHKDGHDNGGGNQSQGSDHDGDADSDSSDTQTENDPDPRESDPEDQADEGDNQHPSGKDRSVENGNSSKNPNQGKAESNPDDSKGPQRFEGGRGDDKPNGPGGEDAADQDGNNGCGNDDDFDDDNNGWCGRPKPTETQPPTESSSQMSIDAACFTVTVTSSKDISHVEVRFADGSDVKFEGLSGHSWSATFAKAITSASAKSGTTVVTDIVTEVCGSAVGGGGGGTTPMCPSNPNLPLNHPGCGTVGGFNLCPADTDNADFPMSDLEDCDKDKNDVLDRVDTVNPVEVCPSGPFKGMPMTSARDCEDAVAGAEDSVLPRFIVNSAETVRGAARPLARAARVVGGVLPFTGAGDALLLFGAALALIGSGALALRVRRND